MKGREIPGQVSEKLPMVFETKISLLALLIEEATVMYTMMAHGILQIAHTCLIYGTNCKHKSPNIMIYKD